MEGPHGPILAQAPERLRPLLDSDQVRLYPDGAFRYLPSSGRPSGSIAAWLRPTGDMASQALSLIPQVNLALTAANTVITAVGFAVVLFKLQQMQKQLRRIETRIARVEEAVQEVLAEVRALRGAVVDLDHKVDLFRDALTQEMRHHKLAEIIGVQMSLEESIRSGRWNEVPRRVDGVNEKVYEAIHLFRALPMETSVFKLDLFRLVVMGRVLITRAYLVMGNQDYAVRAHEEARRTTTSLVGEFMGPHGSFLGTAPTAYLLPDVRAHDPLIAELELSQKRREEMLDMALVGSYPLAQDGERLAALRRTVPLSLEVLTRPGMTVCLASERDVPFTVKAEVGGVYHHPELPVTLERNGWSAVLMAREATAVERRLALEAEVIKVNPRALLPSSNEGTGQSLTVVPVDPELGEEPTR